MTTRANTDDDDDNNDKINNNSDSDQSSDETPSSKKSTPKKSANEMSDQEKSDIGSWGEIATFKAIKDKYQDKINNNKGRFAGCTLEETAKGFIIHNKQSQPLLECVWNNKTGTGDNVAYKESKMHYDFELIKYFDKEGKKLSRSRKLIIEVKSTKEMRPSIAYFRIKEIQEMRKAGDRYRVYRLYGAGNQAQHTIDKLKSTDLPIKEDQDYAALFEVTFKM